MTAPLSSNSALRVIAYTDSAGIGGAEISLGHLVATIAPETHIAVVGVNRSVVEAIADRRPNTQRRVLPGTGIGAWWSHWYTFQQWQPDIIHINLCTPWAGAIGLSAALAVPQARVVRVDQLPLRTTSAIDLWRTRALCLRVDAHVAVGEASARRMEDFYALGRQSVISIPNGVPDQVPPSLPSTPTGQLVVGSVGRLDAMKAHDILLRAIAQVEGVRVVILGEGDRRAALETLADELGVGDRLQLRGWVSTPRDHLAEFDAVALPSRSEGFPLAMVEAMLAERPVVATRVGSIPEAIFPGQTGLLIDKDDVTALAAALRELRDRPELRRSLGQQARQMALKHFTVQAMTDRYEQLWKTHRTQPRTPRLRVPRPRD